MTRRRWALAGGAGLVVVAAAALYLLTGARAEVPRDYADVPRAPRIDPDYAGVSIPPNIAPLNFAVKERGTQYCVRISSRFGEGIVGGSRDPGIVIPLTEWKRLLDRNRGQELRFEVYVREAGGTWRRFETLTNRIEPEEIDPYVAYRRIKPVYSLYYNMGTYQRNLETHEESAILVSRFPKAKRCVNCHSFANRNPKMMSLQMRGPDGLAMLVARDGTIAKIDTRTRFNPSPAAYTSWHPSGRLAAFSVNSLIQFQHTLGPTRDVFDYASDLAIYLADSRRVVGTEKVARPDRLETFPAWSPDGRTLYFCSAKPTWAPDAKKKWFIPRAYATTRYDLMRIPYDINTGEWGEVETVLTAKQTGMSINEPRVSPDGRFVLFCMARYGSFPVYLPSSDLCIMDLETRKYWPLQCNSDQSDSWHCWSSNGRWIVFASKRRDGLFGKLYFSYVDPGGKARKPFLLPQEDPTFYDSFLDNYNVPEFITGRVTVGHEELVRAIHASKEGQSADSVSGATPEAPAE